MLSPKFIVADEAVSALDMSVQGQILNLLNKIKQKYSLTMLFITHDLSLCYYMSDRIAVMYLGNIVEIGPASKVFKNHKHPYTNLLFSSVLRVDKNISDSELNEMELMLDVYTETGCPFYPRCTKRSEKCLVRLPEMINIDKDHYVRCILYEEKN